MKKGLLSILLILALVTQAQANTVAGQMRAPNGSPIRNAAISLQLSQAGISPGDFALVPTTVQCGTDSTGLVVGVANPIVAPTAVFQSSGGTIPAATYYVRLTYYTSDNTETEVSPARQVIFTGTGRLNVTGPTVQPSLAVGYRVYIGTSTGTTYLQSTVGGFGNVTVTTYDTAGAAPPTANNTTCDIQFNDAIIPSFTWYRVSSVLANGTITPGFPQNWYLAGSSVDVSTQYPLAAVAQQTRFPTPLLANPSVNAQQSVNSPVTLNGYSLTAGSIILPAITDAPVCSSTNSVIYTDANGVLTFCQNGATSFGMTDWYDSDTASVIGYQFLARERARVDPNTGNFASLMYDSDVDATVLASRDYTTPADKPIYLQGESEHFFVDSNVEMLDLTTAGAHFHDAVTVDDALAITGVATFGGGATFNTSPVTFNVAVTTTKRVELSVGADVTAANSITLGAGGNIFTINGNTQINAITTASWQAGSVVTLLFTGSPTVKHNTAGGAGTARIFLSAAGDFSATASDNLTLLFDGTQWVEIARTVI